MKTYKLVWNDEFDYTGKPDPTKWSYDIGARKWGNGETQFYTDGANVEVKNGLMTLIGKVENYQDSPYTSCRMTTYGKREFQYGRIEVRAKVPTAKGSWPAIWMLPTEIKERKNPWPKCGEIDIMEHVTHLMDTFHVSLHSELYNHSIKTQRTFLKKIENFSKEFHTFGMDWTKDAIEFFLDGNSYAKFDRNQKGFETGHAGWPFDKPYYLILNIAIGGTWGGAVDPSQYPCEMPVEFVRYYEIIEA
jgi:beta-glucanase (GH16 family)